jgi:tRNA/rRNA methyltransferase
VALVFGPEPSGLTNEEITLCQYLICIPAEESYSALNLAQSVGICLYEMRLATMNSGPGTEADPLPADLGLQQRMFTALESSLREIHYLYGTKAGPLMHGLRRLISRANPTEMEVKLLLGLARQIQWVAAQRTGGKTSSDGLERAPESE